MAQNRRTIDSKNTLKNHLEEYSKDGAIPFHMPGHKRGNFAHLLGVEKCDITEIDGFDNLHNMSACLLDASKYASKVFNVKHTRLLINGSTCGILSAIRGVCKDNDNIVIARNSHKSCYNAVELAHLNVQYIEPRIISPDIYADIDVDDVERALSSSNIKMLVITSPTYEGVISDIESIAKVCHKYGTILFVDEAHGAHLSFANFHKSARELGADIVVNSIHKTLPSLTQTALLHVCSDRVNIDDIDNALAMFESSSPSYILLSSIDGCVHYLANKHALDEWCCMIDELKGKLKLKNLHLLCKDDDNNIFAYDKSKIVVCCDKCSIDGATLCAILRQKYNIECEMVAPLYVVLMTGAGDRKEDYQALIDALNEIDASLNSVECKKSKVMLHLPKKAVESYQINTLSCEYVNIDKSIGRICASTICAYPPGFPIIVKGEIVDSDVLLAISTFKKVGISVIGDKGLYDKIKVVKQN